MRNLFTCFSNFWSNILGSESRQLGLISEEAAFEHPLSTHSAPFGTRWKPNGRLHSLTTIIAVFVMLITIGVGNAWGTGYSFLSSIPSGWSVSPSQNSFESSNNGTSTFGRGACWTKGADPAISATGISGTITEVTVNASTNAGASQASISVTVGGTNFKNNNNNSVYIATGTANARASYTFTGSATGTVAVSINNAKSDKSVWVNNITVTTGGGCSYTVTLSYDGDAASHGEFVLKAGSAAGSTISEGGTVANCGSGSTVVALCPQNVDDHYHLEASNITATNKTGSITSDGNGNFLISYTQGGNVSSSVSVTFTEDTKYTVTWMSNGSQHTTTQVYSGEKPTFPSNPSSCDGTSTAFYGWSTAEWTGALDDVSDKTIYTDAFDMPAVTGDVTYYAVFAKAVKSDNFRLLGAAENFISGEDYLVEAYYSSTDHVLKAADYNSKAYQQVSENSWSLPEGGVDFDMSDKSALCIWKITSEGNNRFSFYNASDNKYLVLVDVLSGGNHYKNLIRSATKDATFIRTVVEGAGNNADKFTFESSSESGYYINSQTNYFQANATATQLYLYKRVTTYSKYLTTCCTPLGTINGSINMSSSTDGTVTISNWIYGDSTNVSSYTVRLYKLTGTSPDAWTIVSGSTSGGASGTQGTRTGIGKAAASKTVTFSGLEYGGTYKFTVTAIGDGSSYCDGEETAVTSINGNSLTDNKFLNKYSIYIDDATNANYAHNYISSISSHAGSVDITLLANKDYYQYKLSLGGVVWWGNDGKMTSASCTSWTFTDGYPNCKLQTNLGGTYTFALAAGTPAISVTYPPDDQASGKNIYFDNSVLEWSNVYYRVGSGSTNVKEDFTLVAGTDNFYYTTTPTKNDISAWHIANNSGWTGSNDIYKTKTGDDYAITKSIAFQQYVVTGHMTIIPTTTSSKGSDDKNNNCDFYTINTPTSGMLTHTATITAPTHGTITISNTDQSLSATSTTANLPHRTILTITATPDDGYSLSSLTVNAAAFTSGNTHILAADATIAATFTANKYDVTLKPTSQTGSVTDQVVQATYDAAMPTTVKTAGTAIVIPERTGYSFTGWFDDSSGGKQYYQYTGSPKTLSSANTWDKTSATNLYAQWSINSYTLTWSWGGGSTSATSGDDYTAAGSVEYNAALTYPADNTMSRNGYTFNGWSSDATNMPAENLTITAQWTANQYTVTLDNKSATTAGTESVIATFGQAIPTIIPPTKTGYRFDGYWTQASGGTKYINANGTSAHTYDKYSDDPTTHKLHAHWVAQIEFSVNGVVDDELTRDVTEALPSSATVPTSCGDCWAFAGWDASSSCSTAPGHAGGESAATHGINTPTTLYAVFGQVKYERITATSGLVANDYYVITMVASDDHEYALAATAHATYPNDAAITDVTTNAKKNSSGWCLYNIGAVNRWKFTGTASSGQLYNEKNSKYLNLSSTSSAIISESSNNLTFTTSTSNRWTINSTYNLRLYSLSSVPSGCDANASGSKFYIYHKTSTTFATEPSCESYTVTWKVDNSSYSTGSPTEETNTCTGIETLPTAPADNSISSCANKFMGWSESKLIGTGKSAPADLFTTVNNAPAIDEDKTFHAVFATVTGSSIAAIEDASFTSKDENGSYCSATFSFKAASKYLQKQSIWTSSEMTDVKVRIRVYHVSNSTADVLRVSLIDKDGTEVVGSDLTTTKTGTSIGSYGGYSSYVDLIPTTAVTGYKVSMKTLNSSGCGINKIERTVVYTGSYTNYMTSCCDELVELSTNSPENGTITFDPVSPIATCDANQNVTMTITPNAGYKLSEWSVATGDGKVAASSTSPAVVTGEDNSDEQEIALTFNQHLSGTYAVSATFEQMHDEYYDYMHDNAKVGSNRTGAYFAPSRTSKIAGKTDHDCKGNHYKFKGWVVSSEINDDGTLKSGYTLIAAGTAMTASNKIYYAVWAEEADE